MSGRLGAADVDGSATSGRLAWSATRMECDAWRGGARHGVRRDERTAGEEGHARSVSILRLALRATAPAQ